ncbi:MAG: VTT domain-containing protein [Oscillospiraceae bacterium]
MKQEIKNSNSRRKIYQFISLIVLIGLLIAGSVLLGPMIVKTARYPEQFRDFIQSKGIFGIFIFIGIQIIQIVFAFIPGEIIEVGAGYAFGAWPGLLLCLIGVLIATMPIFFLTRKFGSRLATIFMNPEHFNHLKFLNSEQQLMTFFFVIYFIPGTPKDLITYLAGLTKIKASTFFILSTLGRIPSILSSTYAGAALGSRNYTVTLIIFGVFGVIGLIGGIIYKKILKQHTINK